MTYCGYEYTPALKAMTTMVGGQEDGTLAMGMTMSGYGTCKDAKPVRDGQRIWRPHVNM